jgi:NADP-dependent 3-hydroxy acid dehydrogenase YdfG
MIKAIATAFAHAGAKGLVLAARSEKELERVGEDVKKANPNTQLLKVVTDVTDEASVENLFKEAHKEFGDLDVGLHIPLVAYGRS